MRSVVNVNWRYIGDAVPAFVTIMFIPFGYSAAYGLIAYVLFLSTNTYLHMTDALIRGLLTYTALNGLIYLTKLISREHIVPEDEDHREYWSSKSQKPFANRGRS